MKTILLAILFAVGSTVFSQQNYKVNTKLSKVEWEGRKIGGSHEGTIQILSGDLLMSGNKINSGLIVIDMKSIEITDIESESSKQKLMDVFESENFFNPKEYPKATLKITGSTELSKTEIEITGTITIKDKSHPIKFRATKVEDENKIVFIGSFEIDRSDYDVSYGSGFFSGLGDTAIKDLFGLEFKIAAAIKN